MEGPFLFQKKYYERAFATVHNYLVSKMLWLAAGRSIMGNIVSVMKTVYLQLGFVLGLLTWSTSGLRAINDRLETAMGEVPPDIFGIP